MDTKHCGKCGKNKLKSEFYLSSWASDGVQTRCKDCQNEHDKIQREIRKHSPATKIRTSKRCNICKDTKPVSQFGKRSQAADKLMSYCKPCWRVYVAKKKKR